MRAPVVFLLLPLDFSVCIMWRFVVFSLFNLSVLLIISLSVFFCGGFCTQSGVNPSICLIFEQIINHGQ